MFNVTTNSFSPTNAIYDFSEFSLYIGKIYINWNGFYGSPDFFQIFNWQILIYLVGRNLSIKFSTETMKLLSLLNDMHDILYWCDTFGEVV